MGMYATGAIPESFLMSSKEKFEVQKHSGDIWLPRSERKVSQEFFLNSNYHLDRLNRSGVILFGDSITSYLNTIKNVLLKDYPEVQSRIHIYTIRHSSLNAFATASGDIYFNIGLIASLNNEAEIAFVLAHEIMHVINRHSLQQVIMDNRLKKSVRIADQMEDDDYMLKKHMYSQSQEIEADHDGLLLFKKSPYSFDAVSGTFEVLKANAIPYNFVDPMAYLIDNEYLKNKLKIEYQVDSNAYNVISAEIDISNYDKDKDKSTSKYSTHPSIKRRIDELLEEYEGLDNSGRKDFVVSEARFNKVQTLANFEMVKLLMEEGSMLYGMCQTISLLEKHPKHPFLESYLAKYMYEISKKKMKESSYLSIVKRLDSIGTGQEKLAYIIHSQHSLDLTILFMYKMQSFIDNSDAGTISRTEKMQKLMFAEMLKQYKHTLTDSSYRKYNNAVLLEDFLAHPVFKVKLEKALAEPDNVNNEVCISLEHLMGSVYLDEVYLNKDLSFYENTMIEPIDTLIIANSFDLSFKVRRRIPIDLVESENMELNFSDRIAYINSLNQVKLYDLSNNDLAQNSDVNFNDHYILNQWFTERLEQNGDDFSSSVDYDIQRIMDSCNTKYAMWNVCFKVRDTQNGRLIMMGYGTAFVSAIVWPFAPQMFSSVFQNLNRTYYMSFVFNLETGDLVMVDRNSIIGNANPGIIGAYLYNSVYHVNNVGQ
jgi:hypothetical protein